MASITEGYEMSARARFIEWCMNRLRNCSQDEQKNTLRAAESMTYQIAHDVVILWNVEHVVALLSEHPLWIRQPPQYVRNNYSMNLFTIENHVYYSLLEYLETYLQTNIMQFVLEAHKRLGKEL